MHILACVSTCCALCSVETRLSMPDVAVAAKNAKFVMHGMGTAEAHGSR